MSLVLIIGKKGAGKDTVGKIIADAYPDFQVAHLADPMKNAAKELFNFSDDQLFGSLKDTVDPRFGVTPRQTLQKLYIEYPRLLGLDETVFAQVFLERKPTLKHIITDVRSLKIINFMKERSNCIVIKVERRNYIEDNHISETELDDYPDYHIKIENNCNVQELKTQVLEKLNKLPL